MVINLSNTSAFIERTATLSTYYREVRKFPILTQEEEAQLFETYKNGSPKEKKYARERLINCNQRFVISVAKKYATNDLILDLINEGNLGLIEAIDSYDINEGVKFTTWAVWYVRRYVNFYIIDHGNIVKRPNAHKTHHVLAQARNKFIQRELRKPTLEELAEMLKKEYGVEIKHMGDIADTTISSIDASFNNDDDDACLGDTALYNSCSASTNLCEKENNTEFNVKLVATLLNKLSPRDKKVIEYIFGIGYDRPYELKEVAVKCGLTTERVRQIKFAALAQMKKECMQLFDTI